MHGMRLTSACALETFTSIPLPPGLSQRGSERRPKYYCDRRRIAAARVCDGIRSGLHLTAMPPKSRLPEGNALAQVGERNSGKGVPGPRKTSARDGVCSVATRGRGPGLPWKRVASSAHAREMARHLRSVRPRTVCRSVGALAGPRGFGEGSRLRKEGSTIPRGKPNRRTPRSAGRRRRVRSAAAARMAGEFAVQFWLAAALRTQEDTNAFRLLAYYSWKYILFISIRIIS